VAGRFEDYLRLPPLPPGSIDAANPRTYPARPNTTVQAEAQRAEDQRAELLASMAATGQGGALVVAHLEPILVSVRGACTLTSWNEGPTTVLPFADVVALFELPKTIDGDPLVTYVRWDVLARVCGPSCWRLVRDLEPRRIITRRWPSPQELEVLRGLSLPEPRWGGPSPATG
jgi:hypothetical protein